MNSCQNCLKWTQNPKKIQEVKAGLEKVQTKVDQVKNICDLLKKSCNDLKNAADNISGWTDEIEQQLNDFYRQREADKDNVDTLICENEQLKSTVYGLEQEVYEPESRSRRESLRFFGLNEDESNSHK